MESRNGMERNSHYFIGKKRSSLVLSRSWRNEGRPKRKPTVQKPVTGLTLQSGNPFALRSNQDDSGSKLASDPGEIDLVSKSDLNLQGGEK